eukprot:1901888-Lingulodinium_polyedra.AAC.1
MADEPRSGVGASPRLHERQHGGAPDPAPRWGSYERSVPQACAGQEAPSQLPWMRRLLPAGRLEDP